MPRTVPEWIGKTDDTPIPPRVRLRVWERDFGRCGYCYRKILVGEAWEMDHYKPLVLGGEHRESNLRVACWWCHKKKTKTEVTIKSKNYHRAAKYLGIKRRKGRPIPGSKGSGFRKRMDGTVIREK